MTEKMTFCSMNKRDYLLLSCLRYSLSAGEIMAATEVIVFLKWKS